MDAEAGTDHEENKWANYPVSMSQLKGWHRGTPTPDTLSRGKTRSSQK